MKYGLPLSVLGHFIVFVSGFLFWTVTPRTYPVRVTEISLENLQIGEVRNLSEIIEQSPDAEEETDEAPAEVEDEIVEPEPPRPQETSPPEQQDLPTESVPELIEDPIPEPTPEPKASPTPKPTPKPTPTANVRQDDPKPKEKSFDDLLNDVAADLPDDTKKPKQLQTKPATGSLENYGDQKARDAAGEGTGNQGLVIDWVKATIKDRGCWRSVSDLPDWERLDVTITFQLDSRGRLSKPPTRVAPKFIPPSDQYMNIASDRAIRAIRECEPFSMPEEKYYLWQNQDIKLTFDEQF